MAMPAALTRKKWRCRTNQKPQCVSQGSRITLLPSPKASEQVTKGALRILAASALPLDAHLAAAAPGRWRLRALQEMGSDSPALLD